MVHFGLIVFRGRTSLDYFHFCRWGSGSLIFLFKINCPVLSRTVWVQGCKPKSLSPVCSLSLWIMPPPYEHVQLCLGPKFPQNENKCNCVFHTLVFKSLFGKIGQLRKMDFAISTWGYILGFFNDNVSCFMFSTAFFTGKLYNSRTWNCSLWLTNRYGITWNKNLNTT